LVGRYSWLKMIRKIAEPLILAMGGVVRWPVNFGATKKVGTVEVEGEKSLRYFLMLLWCYYYGARKLPVETRQGTEMMQNYNKIKLYEYYSATSQKKSVATFHCFEESYP